MKLPADESRIHLFFKLFKELFFSSYFLCDHVVWLKKVNSYSMHIWETCGHIFLIAFCKIGIAKRMGGKVMEQGSYMCWLLALISSFFCEIESIRHSWQLSKKLVKDLAFYITRDIYCILGKLLEMEWIIGGKQEADWVEFEDKCFVWRDNKNHTGLTCNNQKKQKNDFNNENYQKEMNSPLLCLQCIHCIF